MVHHSSTTKQSSSEDNQGDSDTDDSGSTDHGPWTRDLHPKQIKKIIPLNVEKHEFLCVVNAAGPSDNKLSIHVFTENNKASKMDHFPTPAKDIIWSVHVEHNDGKNKLVADTEFFTLSENEETEMWEIWHYHDIRGQRKQKCTTFKFKTRKVLEFPEYATEEAVFVREGVAYAACFVPLEEPEPSMTECYPPDNLDQTLLFFNGRKWIEVGLVPSSSDSLTLWIDLQGNPKFAFVRRHYIYQEAQAGEVCVGIARSSNQDLCWTEVTRNAGRVESLQFDPDGESIIFAANFPKKNRVITTHLQLWGLSWDGLQDIEKTHEPILLSGDVLMVPEMPCEMVQRNVAFFNTVQKDICKSFIVAFSLDPSSGSLVVNKPVPLPFTSTCAPIMSSAGEILFYPSESLSTYVDIRNMNGEVLHKMKQMEPLYDFHVEVINYEAKDGTPLHGFLYTSSKVNIDDIQGLIVWVHGGPFSTILPFRSGCCDYHEEVPFKALLINGFRVFAPVYRGSAGVSKEFAQANIGHHGSLDGDLGDIIQGVEVLQEVPEHGLEGCEVGIFGQSYGGYMVLRALEKAPEIFNCGVSIYGYFNTRWTAMETGDFSWEREYFGEKKFSSLWAINNSDVDLRKINKPVLFLNGAEDDICPAAQARCAYHFLTKRGINTKLIVYKGEGHGFEEKNVQEDRDERVLDWFTENMLSDEEEETSLNE